MRNGPVAPGTLAAQIQAPDNGADVRACGCLASPRGAIADTSADGRSGCALALTRANAGVALYRPGRVLCRSN